MYVITGRTSHDEATRARELGATAVFAKPVHTIWLVRESFRHALSSKFRSLAAGVPGALKSVSVLSEGQPRSVDEWAGLVPCHTSYLRRVWEQAGLQPRHVLKLHCLYRAAFDLLCCNEHGLSMARHDSEEMLELLDYFDTHRTQLMGLVEPACETRVPRELRVPDLCAG